MPSRNSCSEILPDIHRSRTFWLLAKTGSTASARLRFRLASGLKRLEFPIEIADIFPARGDSKFPDSVLNPPDGCPFKGNNLSKTLLGIRHSALDLKTGT